jgi:hypothetical protein
MPDRDPPARKARVPGQDSVPLHRGPAMFPVSLCTPTMNKLSGLPEENSTFVLYAFQLTSSVFSRTFRHILAHFPENGKYYQKRQIGSAYLPYHYRSDLLQFSINANAIA